MAKERNRGRYRTGMALAVWLLYACAAVASDTAQISVSVMLDSSPPEGTILIDNGAAWTTQLAVTLTLDAVDTISGVSNMRFSNDAVAWSGWEVYETTKAWTLAGGADGIRTVYVEYQDGVGNISPATEILATITYHTWHGLTTYPVDTRAYTGDTVTFAVNGDFGPVTTEFQWKWRDQSGTTYNGPTTASWIITGAAPESQGEYWCEIVYDETPYTSPTGVLSVKGHLNITNQPQGATRAAGQTYAFAVAATGGYEPLAYQWRKDGMNVPGQTNSSYAIPSISTTDFGAYTVEIRDANTDVIVSDPATLEGPPASVPGAGIVDIAVLLALTAVGGIRLIRKRFVE